MLAIYKKELRSYFTTPLGYVFAAVFLAVSGVVFGMFTVRARTSDVSTFCRMTVSSMMKTRRIYSCASGARSSMH